MPELPDLQVFARNLKKELDGKTVKEADVHVARKLNINAAGFMQKMKGQTVKDIKRVGKELHIDFKSGDILGLHLMLHGQLFLADKDEKQKHGIITIVFDDGRALTMADYQGAATPTFNPEERNTPDALEVTYTYLKEKMNATRTAVKTLLLDQKVIRGIGNAYADEILWDARISPFSLSNKVPDDKIKALAKSIKSVLHDAEKQILKKDPHIISGEVRDFLLIHNSRKKESPTGHTIHQKTASSRKTYYTDEQEEYK